MPILDVQGLSVAFDDINGILKAVDDVNFQLNSEEILCVVGESGSGKSVTAKALMRLLNTGKHGFIKGQILFEDNDIYRMTEKEFCRLRGRDITMISQEPMSALNPVMTIGDQLIELLKIHKVWSDQDGVEGKLSTDHILDALNSVHIPDPQEMMRKYPFELSGGQCQRVCIAMAILLKPKILIADEPTTALDVTTQAEILRLIHDIANRVKCSVLFITHDLGVVAELATRVIVMYRGRIVEDAPVNVFFTEPKHPYSKGLLRSRPSCFDRRFYQIDGQVEANYGDLDYCLFANRCPERSSECYDIQPTLKQVGTNHRVACLHCSKEDIHLV